MTWSFWLFVLSSFGHNYVIAQGQRVAPGVPPQHYQQPQMHQAPPPQGHHQQVPQHHQQQPPQHQFQQAPVHQQVPVQQQQQHVPIQQGHGHGHDHHQPQQLLNAANIAQEKDHIAEHLDVPMDTSKMTDQELQFHYFKMHDADNNNKLDGCELIKSLIHWHEQGSKDPQHGATAGEKLFKEDELVALIDPILNMDDTNKDGFIDYPEFIQAQQKAVASGSRP